MKKYRAIAVLVSVILTAPLLMGLGGSPPLRDSRFFVSSVTIEGPRTIANSGNANYTVTATIQRDGIALNEEIVGTQGPPPPRIRPSIYAGNTQLTFSEVNIQPNSNTVTATLTLRCSNNEVRGDKAGTGRGGRGSFLWWSWENPAEVKGHLNERESGILRVLCS
ncbi:MAG: hypothetical protein AABY58_00075 [Nitrospirota bacterium]|jgi:hypothetical protein